MLPSLIHSSKDLGELAPHSTTTYWRLSRPEQPFTPGNMAVCCSAGAVVQQRSRLRPQRVAYQTQATKWDRTTAF
jgi:hypothetical protein